jgi:Holliday junction resolvase RusA-like endonuclease
MTYELPLPPSANNLFFNLPKGKGRAKTSQYRDWITKAGWAIAAQRKGAKRFDGPVSLLYEVGKNRKDLGNHEKPLTDLLVHMDVIADDGPSVVREITLRWADVVGVRVTVTPTNR